MSSECLSRGGLSGFIATRPVYSTICFLRDRLRPCPDATLLSLSCAAQPQSISIQNALLMGGVQTSKNAVNAMRFRVHLGAVPRISLYSGMSVFSKQPNSFVISAQVSILSIALIHPLSLVSIRKRLPTTAGHGRNVESTS